MVEETGCHALPMLTLKGVGLYWTVDEPSALRYVLVNSVWDVTTDVFALKPATEGFEKTVGAAAVAVAETDLTPPPDVSGAPAASLPGTTGSAASAVGLTLGATDEVEPPAQAGEMTDAVSTKVVNVTAPMKRARPTSERRAGKATIHP
jgi:hypothetical protein